MTAGSSGSTSMTSSSRSSSSGSSCCRSTSESPSFPIIPGQMDSSRPSSREDSADGQETTPAEAEPILQETPTSPKREQMKETIDDDQLTFDVQEKEYRDSDKEVQISCKDTLQGMLVGRL